MATTTPTKPPAPAPAGLHSSEPTQIDNATLERMIAAPTDWASFVSPVRGFTVWKADNYIDRFCGARAASELAALVATMHGAKCESSTEQSLCETSAPTHIVELVHENGRWYGYGGSYADPDELPDALIRYFDPAAAKPETCEPMHLEIDWCASRRRGTSSRCAPPKPPPERIPTAAQFDAAPEMLHKEPTLGCTSKYVDGYLRMRCPLAGNGHGVIDTHNFEMGHLDITSTTVTWTVKRDRMSAFTWAFDTGLYELGSSPTSAQWVETGTWRDGGAELARSAMKCCIAKHSAPEGIQHGVLGAASTCKAQQADCNAFDTCIQTAIAKRAKPRDR